MSDETPTIDDTFNRLRELYPDDVEQIEAEQERVSKLLQAKAYAELDTTRELIALCRSEIVRARTTLATDRKLDDQARAELWAIVDARQWFLRLVVKDYDGELASIQSQLEAELSG